MMIIKKTVGKRFATIGLVILLSQISGCAFLKPEPVIEVVPVYTPVPTYIQLPEIDRPELAIHRLTDKQKTIGGEIVKAYVASLMQLITYSEALESIIRAGNEQGQRREQGNTQSQ